MMMLSRKFATLRRVWAESDGRAVRALLWNNLYEAKNQWIWWIRRLAHLPLIRSLRNRRGDSSRLHILYVTTAHEALHGQTSRYRIYNLMRALKGTAYTRLETFEDAIGMSELQWADLAVLMRAPRSTAVDAFMKTAACAKVPVVFDIDDLIFLPDYFEKFCLTRPDLTDEERCFEKKSFDGFYFEFRHSACCTTSTSYIAEHMRAAGKAAFVVPNGLNARQLHIARRVQRRKKPPVRRTILYLSGSRTHSRDFAQAVSAIERILQEYSDLRLCVVGYLDLSCLSKLALVRTDVVPFLEWGKMLGFMAGHTINIAPLDISNPFCHAKSELKYFESAIVGVPTVASPTDTFRRCIENGVNGLLADGEEEWYAAFHTLLDCPERYASIRAEAMRRAAADYSPRAVAARAEAVYRDILRETLAAKDSRPQ